jgi:hypothetical protein
MSNTISRPGVFRWIWYAYGGTLPERNRAWVLHDLTARTRWPRQVARTVTVLVPFIAGLVLVVGPSWIAWTAALGGITLATIYSVSYIDQYSEYRLVKHGYPDGTLARVLSAANSDVNTERARRYDSMYRHTAAGR